MKNMILLIQGCLLFVLCHAQNSNGSKPGLSPQTKKYLIELKKDAARLPSGYAYRRLADGEIYASALIKVNNDQVQVNIEALGAHIGTKAGNIWTIQVPLSKVQEFCVLTGIDYIELDQPAYPHLNMARQTTRVDSVHNGINLPMPYTGEGVILGNIDFGFDYNHPAFYDTSHSAFRIKRVWELNSVGNPPPGFAYGNEITDTILIKAQGTDNSNQVHGTGTSGIAAGSGHGSTPQANRFRGVAYQSDFVLVGVRRDTIAQQWLQGSFTDFIDGVNYIFSYATSVSKPAVVNISWGSQSGPHDGSTLFNQACNNLSGPGKIIVMSAGNEGEEKIHLSKTFSAADTLLNTFLKFSSNIYKRTWIDTWGDPGKTFCARVTLYHNGSAGNSTGFYCIDDSIHEETLISYNGTDTCFVQYITSSSSFNGKPRITIDIYSKVTDSVNISITSNDGTIHAWNEYYYYGYNYGYQCAFDSLAQNWAVSGNTVSTVSDMGSADSVILVGAYCSKSNFTDINGNAWTYNGYVLPNRLVPFSSRGPMADGRIKPDITAPGLTLATAISSYDMDYTPTGANSQLVIAAWLDTVLSRTFYYAEFSGTSASAPCVAGIIALMMQVDPALSPQRAKDIIATTAILDAYTGQLPPQGNNNWGHGKINAYQAIKALLIQTGSYEFEGVKLECVLFPNPNNGTAMLSLECATASNLKVEVIDMKGSLVMSNDWKTNAGFNQYPLDYTGIRKGNYLVKVFSPSGSVTIKTIIR